MSMSWRGVERWLMQGLMHWLKELRWWEILGPESTTAVLLQFCTAASLWSHACVISAPCFSVQPSQVNEANQSMNSPDSSTLYCITFLDEGTPPQYQYNTSTIPIRYQYNTSAIPVQHQYNTSTIPVPDTWYRIANSEPNNRGLLTVCIWVRVERCGSVRIFQVFASYGAVRCGAVRCGFLLLRILRKHLEVHVRSYQPSRIVPYSYVVCTKIHTRYIVIFIFTGVPGGLVGCPRAY